MSTKLQIRIKKLVDPELDLKLDYGELMFDDELNRTNEVEFYAYCALDDRVPLILGFKDLLETFAIHFDIRSGVAYLKE